MKKIIIILIIFQIMLLSAQNNSLSNTNDTLVAPLWTGDGRIGMVITVQEIKSIGLSEDDMFLLPLIQSTVIGIFQKYSAMTVFDQLNLENILNYQRQSLTGDFSEINPIVIGRLTNAHYVINGTLARSGAILMIDFAITIVETGVRIASYGPQQVSMQSLRDFSAIRRACLVLLEQLDVNLTEQSRHELNSAESDNDRILGAETLARGRIVDRHGNNIEAATLYFQAAVADPSLLEAIRRISVVSASISDGSLGFAVRNRVREHDTWRNLVNEIKTYYSNYYPYVFTYNPDIELRGVRINFSERTASFSIPIKLSPSEDWEIINDFRKGLIAAQGNDRWNFNLNQVGPSIISVSLQAINASERSLAIATHTFDGIIQTPIITAMLRFDDVSADDMEGMNIRVYRIDNKPLEKVLEERLIQIQRDDSSVAIQRQRSRKGGGFVQGNYFFVSQFDNKDFNKFAWRLMEGTFNYPLGSFFTCGFHFGVGGYSGPYDEDDRIKSMHGNEIKPYRIYGNIGPAVGISIPGESTMFYSTGLLEIGYFGGHWKGIIEDWVTPSLNVGMIFGRDIGGFNVNYRMSFFQDTFTHTIGIGYGVIGIDNFLQGP